MGIVIGDQVKTLGRIKIYQGATLGGNKGKPRNIKGRVTAQPVIHDNVNIGINSSILGGVEIGQSAYVGVGAIVTKDIPPNSIVVGVNKIK